MTQFRSSQCLKSEGMSQLVGSHLEDALVEPLHIFLSPAERFTQARRCHDCDASRPCCLSENEVEAGCIGISIDDPHDPIRTGEVEPFQLLEQHATAILFP
jgi:hypothetical protein